MKHIKPYKIFESFSNKVKEDIEDIFGELELDGIIHVGIIESHYNTSDVENNRIIKNASINVILSSKSQFRFEDVEDCILRLPDYFKTIDGEYGVRITSTMLDGYYTIREFIREFEYDYFLSMEIIIIQKAN